MIWEEIKLWEGKMFVLAMSCHTINVHNVRDDYNFTYGSFILSVILVLISSHW